MDRKSDSLYQYSPDVSERESSDNGFSRGWGMHFPAAEEYWFDIHAHVEYWEPEELQYRIREYLEKAEGFNINSTALILPMIAKKTGKENQITFLNYFPDGDSVKRYISMFDGNPKFKFFLYLDHRKPDTGLLREAANAGICGIKLHNAPVITDGDDCAVWLSDEWRKVFCEIEKLGLPVLWHVTQRLTDSPYTGGGRNSYWKDGWEKGVTYTNEDLLQVYLKIVEGFPGINFISAHQLHLGWERLAGLFDRYENLFSDTSIGCYLRMHDEVSACDREYIRDIYCRYGDRMLFGTDIIIGDEFQIKKHNEIIDGHIRFIKQLRLPYEVLQNVSHLNALKLFKI